MTAEKARRLYYNRAVDLTMWSLDLSTHERVGRGVCQFEIS